jgi:hypothetical protein
MANALFPVLTLAGGEVLPTANATYYTLSMDYPQAQHCQVFAEFFSDAAGTIPVSPTGGEVKCWVSPMGINYVTAGNAASIKAIDCGTPLSNYVVPLFYGRAEMGRIEFSGITGAPYARVNFWRF